MQPRHLPVHALTPYHEKCPKCIEPHERNHVVVIQNGQGDGTGTVVAFFPWWNFSHELFLVDSTFARRHFGFGVGPNEGNLVLFGVCCSRRSHLGGDNLHYWQNKTHA